MDWRRPTKGEACEIALVLLVLMAGVGLLIGLPSASVSRDHTAHLDWACASAPADETGCAGRAAAPTLEGRAMWNSESPMGR